MGRPVKSHLPAELAGLLKQIGANLTDLRAKKGLSQAELARRSKISTTTLNEIESRQFRDVRLSTLSALAHALGVSVIEVLQSSDVEINSKDQARLLKASEAIVRITRKLRHD